MESNQGILLETGTNEFEIIEFSIGNTSYGINVAKVREIINAVPVTKLPNSHSYVAESHAVGKLGKMLVK